jgi:hypothetical protein
MITEPIKTETAAISAVEARGAVRGNGVIFVLVFGTIAAVVGMAFVVAVHFG